MRAGTNGDSETRLRLRLLGRFDLSRLGRPNGRVAIASRKGRALLAYLAMHAGETVPRFRVTALLWGDRSDKQARQSLRQCLMDLRQELGDLGERAIQIDNDAIALDPAVVEVDVTEFLAASRRGTAAALKTATSLYAGDLTLDVDLDLSNVDEWFVAERERLHTVAVETFDAYVKALTAAGDFESAHAVCERLLALDSLREATHRLILPLEVARNGRAAALTRFEALAGLLKREFGVQPEPATLETVAAIRNPASSRGESQATAENSAPNAEAAWATSNPALSTGRAKQAFSRFGRGWHRAAAIGLAAIAALAGLGVATDFKPGPLVTVDGPVGERIRTETVVSTSSDPHRLSLVVLPFAARSADAPTQKLASILTEDITSDLSHMSFFTVISRQTAIAYRNTTMDARALGLELGVNYLLTGNVLIADDVALVRVQLADTRSGKQIWAGRFERSHSEWYRVEEEIVQSIGRHLQIEVTFSEARRGERKDPTVSELVWRGYALIYDSISSGSPRPEIVAIFEEALSKRPNSAPAMVGLAGYLVTEVLSQHSRDRDSDLARAELLLARAVELAPRSSLAVFYQGLLRKAQQRYEDSLVYFNRAIELNPSFAVAQAQAGHVLVFLGRAEETEAFVRKAMRLSPKDPSVGFWKFILGEATLLLGRTDEAIEWLEQSARTNPSYGRTHLLLAAAYTSSGDDVKAVNAMNEFLRLSPGFSPQAYRALGAGGDPHYLGQRERLLPGIERTFALARSRY